MGWGRELCKIGELKTVYLKVGVKSVPSLFQVGTHFACWQGQAAGVCGCTWIGVETE